MEQLLAEYFVNSIWQVLLVACGAWLLLRALRPSPQVQHWIWMGVLPLLLLMPLLSLHSGVTPQVQITTARPDPTTNAMQAETTDLPVPTQLLEHAAADIPDLTSSQSPIQAPTRPDTWREMLHWPPVRAVSLGPAATLWVVGFYLATMAFAFIRLLYAWQTARRVIARATPANLNRGESLLVDQCCRRLGVSRPTILESSEVRSPMVVGVLRPLLLLPVGFANPSAASTDRLARDLEAVLLHELAHLQRRDCAANLACRIVALPIAYHPATWAVRQRIRQTQEMLCDAIAAAEMQSPVRYARCLVGLAQNMQSSDGQIAQIYGATMFDGKILEERVMQLIQTRKAVNLRTQTMRLACGIAVIVTIMAVAATFHVTPTFAETPGPSIAVATQTTPEVLRSGQSNPVDTPIDADAAGSSQQTDHANQQFDAAMRIVHDRLNRSSNIAIRNAEVGTQRAAIRGQIDEAGIEAQIASAHEAAGSVEMAAEIARAQAKFDSPEFKKRMADMQAKFNSPEFKQKMKDAQAKFDNAEFKKRMADMQAKFNSAEFKQRMTEAQARLNDPEFRNKMEKLNSPEFQRQIAAATAKANNPELRKQLENLNQKYREQLQEILRQFSNEAPLAPPPPTAPTTR